MDAGASFGGESARGASDTGGDHAPLNTVDSGLVHDSQAPEAAMGIDARSDSVAPPDVAARMDTQTEANVADATASEAAIDGSSSDVVGDDVDSSVMSVDASDGASCDFSGTWATRVVIDVNWVPQGIMGVILAPGSGQIKQWLLSTRVVNGLTTTDTASVCGIALPDFMGTAIAGGEKYGIQFPDALFDTGTLSTFTIAGTLTGTGLGATMSTSPTAVLLGLTLSNPAMAPWPGAITTEVDSDQDGKPGVTAWASQDAGYSEIQVDPFGNRGDRVYLAIRQVTSINGSALDCDSFAGNVNIPQIPDGQGALKYAIDSHVLGCHLVGDAGDCNPGQATFVDTTQPVFSPSGATTFASVRVANDATCATARQRLP